MDLNELQGRNPAEIGDFMREVCDYHYSCH
jgi:hypothetical protein